MWKASDLTKLLIAMKEAGSAIRMAAKMEHFYLSHWYNPWKVNLRWVGVTISSVLQSFSFRTDYLVFKCDKTMGNHRHMQAITRSRSLATSLHKKWIGIPVKALEEREKVDMQLSCIAKINNMDLTSHLCSTHSLGWCISVSKFSVVDTLSESYFRTGEINIEPRCRQ